MSNEVDDFLAHYGVKGQKWGVRRKRGGTKEQRRAGTKKLARNLAVGGALGIATGVAAVGVGRAGNDLRNAMGLNLSNPRVTQMASSGRSFIQRVNQTAFEQAYTRTLARQLNG